MSFKDWLKKNEMVGTGAVYDGTKSPDFNWWGDPESSHRPPKYASAKDFKYSTSLKIVRSKKNNKKRSS